MEQKRIKIWKVSLVFLADYFIKFLFFSSIFVALLLLGEYLGTQVNLFVLTLASATSIILTWSIFINKKKQFEDKVSRILEEGISVDLEWFPGINLFVSSEGALSPAGMIYNKGIANIGIFEDFLEELSDDELKAVINHERYHAKAWNWFLVNVTVALLIALSVYSFVFLAMISIMFFPQMDLFQIASLVSFNVFSFLMSRCSLRFTEYAADSYSVLQDRKSEHVISALKTSELTSGCDDAQFFVPIWQPMWVKIMRRIQKYLSIFFSTHPSLKSRIRLLRWIEK